MGYIEVDAALVSDETNALVHVQVMLTQLLGNEDNRNAVTFFEGRVSSAFIYKGVRNGEYDCRMNDVYI